MGDVPHSPLTFLPLSPAVRPQDTQDTESRGSDSTVLTPLPSPSASTFLRTVATLEGLSRQLEDLTEREDPSVEIVRCCCGGNISGSCPMGREREKMEDKLKLSGEIGNALLQRYEALEKKHQRQVEKYEHQLEIKRTALAESVRRVNNLEKANTTHMQRYAEMSKKNEALEKRYTQASHTQTLTQQSLTHVRAELTSLRNMTHRQSLQLVSGAGVEERLLDAEKRYEDTRELYEVEARKIRDETRKRKRAEARIAELEGQLSGKAREVDEVKEARAKDAQDLLANAKDRLAILHSELSETFRAESPSEMPEYQRTLEDLVANNALLKHDASELSHLLAQSREELRSLREEVDELRSAVGVAGRVSPENLPASRRLANELSRSHSHSRTESTPSASLHGDRSGWNRMSVNVPAASRWEHHRKSSLAPSFASTSTSGEGGLTSPGLGMGPIGEYNGAVVRDESISMALSPPVGDGRESPKPIFRTSPSGGIGYVLNGVPKNKVNLPRPPVRRSVSDHRPRPILRTYSPSNVEAIAEWGPLEGDSLPGATPPQVDEPQSPAGSEYFRSAEASRKRRSLLLSRTDTASLRDSTDYSPNASHTLVDQSLGGDITSPMSDGGLISPREQKRVHRRTLLLLTRSTGTQTEPVTEVRETGGEGVAPALQEQTIPGSVMTSTGTSPNPPVDESETSSIHDHRSSSGVLTALMDHLSKILTKLRSADIPTLNKRLKKQHLPGDVGHLSRSTMRNLQLEVSDLRNAFRGISDYGTLNKREFILLLKLLKDIFNELIELQAVVNDVTIEPRLAKKLQKEAFKNEEDLNAGQGGGLGWIAAPITKFFVTPANETVEESQKDRDSPRAGRVSDRGRLQPGTIRAPKLQASTSATTTHVSVEFGGSGIVRRATPAMTPGAAASTSNHQASNVVGVLPPSPDPSGEQSFAQHNTNPQQSAQTMSRSTTSGGGSETLAPPTIRPTATTLQTKSRANRNELLGIFAGAAPRPVTPTGGESWVVLGQGNPPSLGGAPRQLRATSSQYFGDRTIRKRDDTGNKKRLSAAVDAVIDRTADQLDDDDPETVSSFNPPLLERTLRPRGLSDSSIRSTFVSQENPMPSERILSSTSGISTTPAGRMGGYGSSYLGSLAGKFYPFRATTTEPILPKPAPEPTMEVAPVEGEAAASSVTIPKPKVEHRSPARPIPASPSQRRISSSKSEAISPTVSSSQGGAGAGFLGMLASSISAGREGIEEEVEDEEETDLRGAGLRRGMARHVSAKGSWR